MTWIESRKRTRACTYAVPLVSAGTLRTAVGGFSWAPPVPMAMLEVYVLEQSRGLRLLPRASGPRQTHLSQGKRHRLQATTDYGITADRRSFKLCARELNPLWSGTGHSACRWHHERHYAVTAHKTYPSKSTCCSVSGQ